MSPGRKYESRAEESNAGASPRRVARAARRTRGTLRGSAGRDSEGAGGRGSRGGRRAGHRARARMRACRGLAPRACRVGGCPGCGHRCHTPGRRCPGCAETAARESGAGLARWPARGRAAPVARAVAGAPKFDRRWTKSVRACIVGPRAGGLAQWESAGIALQRSRVQIPYPPPVLGPAARAGRRSPAGGPGSGAAGAARPWRARLAVLLARHTQAGDGRPGVFHRELERRHPDRLRDVVFLTGDVLSTDIREFLERTGAPTLTKPFVPGDIRRLLHAVAARADHAGPSGGGAVAS